MNFSTRLKEVSIPIGIVLVLTAMAPIIAEEEGDDLKLKETCYFLLGTEELSSKKEVEDLRAAWKKDPNSAEHLWRSLRVASSVTLGRLGYGTGPFRWQFDKQEEEAIRRFQEDLSIPITGKLDSLTLIHLGRASKALDTARITLPPKLISHVGDYIRAQGTWKGIDCDLASPINTSIVECDRTRAECEVIYTEFISENLSIVSLSTEVYKIVSWSKDGDLVVAETEAPCRRHVLTVNITTEDVTLNSYDKEACGKTEFKTMTSKLVNGSFGENLKDVKDKVYGRKEFYERLLRKNMIGVD